MADSSFPMVFILTLSIIIQAAAAIMAVRLISITGRRSAWSLIALALTLMAVRRVVPLYRLILGDASLPPDPLNEIIGLALSAAMAAGIAFIAPLFIERKQREEALAERVMLAELSADIGSALATQGELRSILNGCAEALVRRLDVAFARIWVLNTAENVLELRASAGMYTRIDGSHSRVPVGKFKIGLIAEERKPHITHAVIGDPRVHDQEWAKREGMAAFAGHPLTIEDKLVGVLAMFSRNPLTDITLKALAVVSNEIAVGIERKLAEEKLHRLNRELRAISSCNQTLMRADNEQKLINDICHIVCEEAGYRLAWVGHAENDEHKTIRIAAQAGAENGYLEQAVFTWADTERGGCPAGSVIRTGKSVCIQDFASAPQDVLWRDSALRHGYRSGIVLPLKDESACTFGTLGIYSTEPNAFTPDELRLLEELAGDLAFGIMVLRARNERRRSEEALREQERYTQSLLHLSRKLERAQTYNEALTAARAEVRAMIGYQNLWAYLLTEDRKYAHALVAAGPTSDFVLSEEGSATLAIEGDRMLEEIATATEIVLVADAQTDKRVNKEMVKRLGVRTIVNVPILLFDRLLGSIGTGTFGEEGVRVPSSSEQNYLIAMARHMAVTFDRIYSLTQRKRAEDALKHLNAELDHRVKERTAELETKNAELISLNKLFIGRELRMIELKERIRELENEVKGGTT